MIDKNWNDVVIYNVSMILENGKEVMRIFVYSPDVSISDIIEEICASLAKVESVIAINEVYMGWQKK